MDESLQELETELKSLQPRRPSAQWSARVGRELAVAPARTQYTSATNLSSWKWFGWRSAVTAAAVALVTTLGVLNFKPVQPASVTTPPVVASTNSAPASRDHYPPVTATNVLYDLKDEGLVQVDSDTSARRLRYRYLDTYTLKNPKGNASLKWSVPRDEIRVLPTSFN
jgi:hypothetical protein